MASTSQLSLDFQVPEEDYVVDVLGAKSEALTVLQSQVDELGLSLVDDIVVTDQLLSLLLATNFVERASALHLHGVDSVADGSLENKVHLSNLLILLVDNLVSWV